MISKHVGFEKLSVKIAFDLGLLTYTYWGNVDVNTMEMYVVKTVYEIQFQVCVLREELFYFYILYVLSIWFS